MSLVTAVECKPISWVHRARCLAVGLAGCLSLCFGTSGAAANTSDHLYEISLLAVDQSDSERQKTLRQGLEKILVRISGQTDVIGNASIQEAMASPDTYLQQFGYVSLTEAEKADIKNKADTLARTAPRSAAAVKGAKTLPVLQPTIRMNASFAPESIKALLRRAQLPIWSSNRPSVLVWLVIDSGAGRHLLSPSDNVYAFLLQEAERRGLPVVLPMNDLNDQVALGGINHLWDLDQAAIVEASQRYGEDSVLVGRIAQTATAQWQGNWLKRIKSQRPESRW